MTQDGDELFAKLRLIAHVDKTGLVRRQLVDCVEMRANLISHDSPSMTKNIAKRTYDFVQLDVFTQTALNGNPLAVFPDARGLSDNEMQALAREMTEQPAKLHSNI